MDKWMQTSIKSIVLIVSLASLSVGDMALADDLSEKDKAAVEIGSRGPEADQSYKNILWALGKMPRKYKDLLWSNGYHVVSCTTIDEWQTNLHALPFHTQEHPNWTYKNLSGLTNNRLRQILVGQTLFGKPVNHRVMFHESGHAFDFIRHISKSKAFIDAFALDGAQQTDKTFAWKTRSETCAQLVAVELCKNIVDVSDRPALTTKFSDAWPRCAQIVRNQLNFYR